MTDIIEYYYKIIIQVHLLNYKKHKIKTRLFEIIVDSHRFMCLILEVGLKVTEKN